MGQAQLSVENFRDDQVAAQAATAYQTRGVPTDWYVDPADPEAAAFHERENRQGLEDAATAFLSTHDEPDDLLTGELSALTMTQFGLVLERGVMISVTKVN